MEAGSGVLRVMPEDNIEWEVEISREVEISSQSRIHMVHAFFLKETEDPTPRQLALGGEVYTFERQGGLREGLREERWRDDE